MQGRKHNILVPTIFLCGDVTEQMVGEFMEQFVTLDSEKRPSGIVVRITSHGGCAGAGFAIHDAIANARNHVTTEAWGMAESIAALIFQAGRTRLMAPSARLLLHDVQTESNSTTGSRGLQAHVNDIKALEELYFRTIAARGGIKTEQVKKWCASITAFSAQAAIATGLADALTKE